MEDIIVEINAQIEESRLDQLEASLNNLGVKFTVQKQLTFEDLGLVEVETGLFQCLVCSKMNKRKHNAVAHFRKQHTYQVTNMNSFVKCFWFVCFYLNCVSFHTTQRNMFETPNPEHFSNEVKNHVLLHFKHFNFDFYLRHQPLSGI